MPSSHRWPWEAQGVRASRSARQAERAHNLNRWLTIFLPVGAGAVLLVVLAMWFSVSAGDVTVGHASAVVVMAFAALCMLAGMPVLAVLVALIVFAFRAYDAVPEKARQAMQGLYALQRKSVAVADRAVSPFVRWQMKVAAARAWWRALLGGKAR